MAWRTASGFAEGHFSPSVRRWLKRTLFPVWMGSLYRSKPVSSNWGFDRGRPVDRYYIESFLENHRADIHGRVLEIMNSDYTDRFGSRVECADVLDIDASNPKATIIADLATADSIPGNSFDCFILNQTLQLIYDVKSAIGHSHRILRPGGVLLVTVPCLSRLAGQGFTDYWRFTPNSAERLFGDIFGKEQVTMSVFGNVLSAVAFLEGIACEELPKHKLDRVDERYPMLIAIRAVKK
jgi:SAM-dependent methyltransferase